MERVEGRVAWVSRIGSVGNVIYTSTEPGGLGIRDVAWGVALDVADNIVIAGSTLGPGGWTGQDRAWVRKLALTGAELWTLTFDAPDDARDEALAVATDSSGNVVVAGFSRPWYVAANGTVYPGELSTSRMWVGKYRPDGTEVWTIRGGDEGEVPNGIAVDPFDNIIAAGMYMVPRDGRMVSDHAWVRKLDPSGNGIWLHTYKGATDRDDAAFAVAGDSAGNIIVAGATSVACEAVNTWVRKYDPDGAELWTRSYNGAANADDIAYGVAVDSADNIMAAGQTLVGQGDGRTAMVWLAKYLP
jgi:hypothetical protein